jgi:hypothetical protein
METLLWLLGYLLAAGICILVGRGMWRAWVRHAEIAAARERSSAGETTPPACDVPPAGWTCSREAGHDGPCAARPLNLHPGQIIEVPAPHVRYLDYHDYWQMAQAEDARVAATWAAREPQTYEDGLALLNDAYIYLLRRAQMDNDTADILDRARLELQRVTRYQRPRPRRVLADAVSDREWR